MATLTLNRWLCLKQLLDSPGQSDDDNLLTYICLDPERLAGSRCTSAPIMTGVPPPERALYNQKIILLFPVAALILSSSKQPWEVWRRTTGTIPTPANNTQVHADMITHGTRHFCFPFPPQMHLQSPTRVENTWKEHLQDRPRNLYSLPLLPALLACFSLLYHAGVGVLSWWLTPLRVHYRHRHTIWVSCSGDPAKTSIAENRACPDGWRDSSHQPLCHPPVKW